MFNTLAFSTKKAILMAVITILLIGGTFFVIKSAQAPNTISVTNSSHPLSEALTPGSPTEFSYGTHPLEKLDVYKPTNNNAPIIVMVHGGKWMVGDKANDNVFKNKVNRWVPQGYIVVSVNYPMYEDGFMPDEQAGEVAKAIAYIQGNTQAWGGDASRIVVMGHSAGAHLVSLVSATRASYAGLKPWAGTVLLDSATYNVVSIMSSNPDETYVSLFGTDKAYWEATSPIHHVNASIEPTFVVCSSLRARRACEGAGDYVEALKAKTVDASLLSIALSHEDINEQLGLESTYTSAVDDFIRKVVPKTSVGSSIPTSSPDIIYTCNGGVSHEPCADTGTLLQVTYNGTRLQMYHSRPESKDVDVVLAFHGTTIDDDNILPAAEAMYEKVTSIIKRDNLMVISVAYPQEGLLLGDNITHAEAALLWVKERASEELGVNIHKIYLIGHSQGGYLVTRLNTMHKTDGVIANGSGPIDLADRCTLEEQGVIKVKNSQSDGGVCKLLKETYGSALINPEAYSTRSLIHFASGFKSKILFVQGEDDTALQMKLWQQYKAELTKCTNCAPYTILDIPGVGHRAVFESKEAKTKVNEFIQN